MAIIKKVEIKNTGLEVEYWRVISTTRDMNRNEITARIVCYKDEKARRLDKRHVLSVIKRFDASDCPLNSNEIEWVYKKLKSGMLEMVMPEIHEEQSVSLEDGKDV